MQHSNSYDKGILVIFYLLTEDANCKKMIVGGVKCHKWQFGSKCK